MCVCVINGVGHYIEKSGEKMAVSLHKIYVMRSLPFHEIILSEFFCVIILAGGITNIGASQTFRDSSLCCGQKVGDCWGMIAIGPAAHRVCGPFGPGNPGRVRKESGKSTPGQGPQSPERVHPGVLKESKSQVVDSFRTLLRLRGALFRDFWGPAPGCSLRTLFGLFRVSGPEGPETLCAGPMVRREKNR